MKVSAFNLSMTGVISRFYAMMLTAIILGFLGVSWPVISFITFAFAFTTILGVSFELPREESKAASTATMTSFRGGKKVLKAG